MFKALRRDPKDSAMSWNVRFGRITGNNPGYADFVNSSFPYWVSPNGVTEEQGQAYLDWCHQNLQQGDFVVSKVKPLRTDQIVSTWSFWATQHVMIIFTRDSDAIMFKLAHSSET